ncbi:MAG: helix-turn-helix domain-containing protein [Candidatus Electrothrix sp. LOE2]|nr:helix-turn-helix domain-containing protein [Candidatus Electrothrix sp. LOE2]
MSEKFSSVWDALFDDPGEKAVLEIKSGLMDEIRQYLKHERLTQEKAAEILGISQPRISDISTGKISRFTIDALVGILAKAGIDIEIRPKNQNNLIKVPPQEWSRSRLKMIRKTDDSRKKQVGDWSVDMSGTLLKINQENILGSDVCDEYALEA